MAEGHGDAKGATAHTEAEGGHKAPFPPFQKDTFASQLVSLLIAFVALYLIVSKIALPRVGGLLDARGRDAQRSRHRRGRGRRDRAAAHRPRARRQIRGKRG